MRSPTARHQVPSPAHHRIRRSVALGAAVALVTAGLLVVATPALAGKPAPAGSASTLSLVLLDSTDGQAHHGQRVTFAVTTTATTQPHVRLKCSQNGVMVYTTQTGYYASYPWPSTQVMTLASGAWTSGAASCTAVLYWFNGSKTVTGATLNFPVAA